MFKVTYNAPVTLTFVILCFAGLGLQKSGMVGDWFTMPSQLDWKDLSDWVRLVTWVFGHGSWPHLFSNMLLILLVGPMLEEKLGSKRIFQMIVLTAVLTALVNVFVFHDAIYGASGVVFMLIMLGSLTNFQTGEIPLTFLLVAFVFIGQELLAAGKEDQVSQYAHIAGGIIGSIFGFALVHKKTASSEPIA